MDSFNLDANATAVDIGRDGHPEMSYAGFREDTGRR